MGDLVLVDLADGIATITLNRPEVGNALNKGLLAELMDALIRLGEDESVGAVIITGAGRMFCSGEDLRGLGKPEDAEEQIRLTVEAFDLLRNLPQPTIAAVNGYAITGGLELSLYCDLRVASETALFADTHARVGMAPGAGDSQMLPRLIGLARAKEMLFTSEFLTAQQAAQAGFLNRVVPPERLLEEARALARKIVVQDRQVIARIKKLVNDGWQKDLEAGMLLEHIEYQRSLMENRLSTASARRQSIQDRNRASLSES